MLLEKLEVHSNLNPKLWTSSAELLPDVERKLFDIVDAFTESMSIPIDIIDARLVGSNASYNYTQYSDIDLHIVANFEAIDVDSEVLQSAYNLEKSSFNKTYDISIHGLDVEVYIEDVRASTVSNGIYSLYLHRWIKFPKKIDVPDVDVSRETSVWERRIDTAVGGNGDDARNLLNSIYLVRKNSLEVDGEFGKGNVLFKELRNLGLLDKLRSKITQSDSKRLSLEGIDESLRLNEDSRNALLTKSKSSIKGRQRYNRRLKSKVADSVRQFNDIDMNKLFKDDILTVNIAVKGETDDYTVRISFGGFLEILHDEIERNSGKLELKPIARALITGFNKDDVFIGCNCCLKGDTKIKLLNGENITIAEMYQRSQSGEKFYVYSTDDQGDFKPGEVSDVFISKYVNDMIKVTLDNGEVVETTPDHPYMLRDGSYLRADALAVGQSLMPMYFSYHNGYENYKKNSVNDVTKFCSVYKEVANTLLADKIDEAKIRSGEDIINIHHKDFNKLNNYPTNLVPMGANEHWKYHYEHLVESGVLEKFLEAGHKYWETDEARRLQAEVCRKAITSYYANRTPEEIERDRAYRSKHIRDAWARGCFDTEAFKLASFNKAKNLHTPEMEALATQGVRNYWANLTGEAKEKRLESCIANAKIASDAVRGKKFTDEHRRKISETRKNFTDEQRKENSRKTNEAKILSVLTKCIELGKDLNEENYEIVRKNEFRTSSYPRVTKRFESVASAVSYFGLNHKVAKIEHIHYDEPIPVYDMTVPTYSNFLVSAGVILHNCDFYYRFGFWSTRNGISSIEPQNIPSRITNPSDKLGAGCKHVLLVLSNNSWLLKCASVINNYIKYIEKHYPKLYADVIYPAIYKKPYEEPVQLSLLDTEDDELISDKDTIDISNTHSGRDEKGRFASGNTSGIRFSPNDSNGQSTDQLSLLDDEL